MNGRPWTRAERGIVRQWYGLESAAAVAARVNRTARAVYQLVASLGRAARRTRWTVAKVERLAKLVRAGHTDTEIATTLRADRHAVGDWRRALGLPANANGVRHRASIRRAAARQVKRAGLGSLAELRVKAWGDHSEKHGLPRELNPTAVRVVLALAAGPKTRREIVAALGRAWKAGNRGRNNLNCRKGGGSYLAWLDKLGLVRRVPRYVRAGKRGATQQESVYRLTPTAVERLRGAGVPVLDAPGVVDAADVADVPADHARGCTTPGCSRPYYASGRCKSCYHRPYSRAFYHRKKHDPEWLASRNTRIAESKQRRQEMKALADLARIAAELEEKL